MDTQDLMGADYTKPAPAKKDHTEVWPDLLCVAWQLPSPRGSRRIS